MFTNLYLQKNLKSSCTKEMKMQLMGDIEKLENDLKEKENIEVNLFFSGDFSLSFFLFYKMF